MPTAEKRRRRAPARGRAGPPREELAVAVAPQAAHDVGWFAKRWIAGVGGVYAIIVASVAAAVKDTAKALVPSAAAITQFTSAYPTLTWTAVVVVGLVTGIAIVIAWRQPATAAASRSVVTTWLQRPVVSLASIAIATIASLAFVSLFGLLMLRPSWCPAPICQATLAQYPGPQDGYLGAEVFAVQ